MKKTGVWGDYNPEEYCLEKSYDVKMYHVSPRMWIVIFNEVVHRFTRKADAERFYKQLIG